MTAILGAVRQTCTRKSRGKEEMMEEKELIKMKVGSFNDNFGVVRITRKELKEIMSCRIEEIIELVKKDLDKKTVFLALSLLGIDELGLSEADRSILQTIITKFGGGPVGLNTIAAATSEEEATIEEVIEPYLLQQGLLDRTPRGRVATKKAFDHLGFEYTEKN